MKIIPVLFIVLGIITLYKKHKLSNVDIIYFIVYYLCGYGAIILGFVNLILDLGLRKYLIEYNLYSKYHFSFIGGVFLGWVIIFLIIEIILEKRKKRKIAEKSCIP